MNNEKAVNEYLAKRAETSRYKRDDRESRDKLSADAELRGKLGVRRGNEVIRAIDDLKSRGY